MEANLAIVGLADNKTGKLADFVQMATGMKAKVLLNLATEALQARQRNKADIPRSTTWSDTADTISSQIFGNRQNRKSVRDRKAPICHDSRVCFHRLQISRPDY